MNFLGWIYRKVTKFGTPGNLEHFTCLGQCLTNGLQKRLNVKLNIFSCLPYIQNVTNTAIVANYWPSQWHKIFLGVLWLYSNLYRSHFHGVIWNMLENLKNLILMVGYFLISRNMYLRIDKLIYKLKILYEYRYLEFCSTFPTTCSNLPQNVPFYPTLTFPFLFPNKLIYVELCKQKNCWLATKQYVLPIWITLTTFQINANMWHASEKVGCSKLDENTVMQCLSLTFAFQLFQSRANS